MIEYGMCCPWCYYKTTGWQHLKHLIQVVQSGLKYPTIVGIQLYTISYSEAKKELIFTNTNAKDVISTHHTWTNLHVHMNTKHKACEHVNN